MDVTDVESNSREAGPQNGFEVVAHDAVDDCLKLGHQLRSLTRRYTGQRHDLTLVTTRQHLTPLTEDRHVQSSNGH